MCICDSSYPRKLAFSYLDELSKEFQRSYEGKIEGVTRPYAFMGFGMSSSTSFSLPPNNPEKQRQALLTRGRYVHIQDYTTI